MMVYLALILTGSFHPLYHVRHVRCHNTVDKQQISETHSKHTFAPEDNDAGTERTEQNFLIQTTEREKKI